MVSGRGTDRESLRLKFFILFMVSRGPLWVLGQRGKNKAAMWPLYTRGSQALGHPDQSLSSMMMDLTLFLPPCHYSISGYGYRFPRGDSRHPAFSEGVWRSLRQDTTPGWPSGHWLFLKDPNCSVPTCQ